MLQRKPSLPSGPGYSKHSQVSHVLAMCTGRECAPYDFLPQIQIVFTHALYCDCQVGMLSRCALLSYNDICQTRFTCCVACCECDNCITQTGSHLYIIHMFLLLNSEHFVCEVPQIWLHMWVSYLLSPNLIMC